MEIFKYILYIACIVLIQIFLVFNILGSIDLDLIANKCLFIKKKKINAQVVGFTRGYFWKKSGCRGDYLSIVSFSVGDITYNTRIIRGESDKIGENIKIVIYNNLISCNGRGDREVPYMKKNGLKLIDYYLLMWLMCCFIVLVLFHALSFLLGLSILGQLLLNYLMMPFYLIMRKKTW